MLNACQAHDAKYYQLNPKALQQAIKECPDKAPLDISCAELKTVAERVNALSYELQMNPQGFGRKILALQEELANQELKLTQNPKQDILVKKIKETKKQLAQRLAIVRWLESPEG